MNNPTSDEPAAGTPWDLSPRDAPIVFFDLEMTGLDPLNDAIVEVAFVRTEGGCSKPGDQFASLVACATPASPAALALHGIDAQALREAPTFTDLAPRIESLLRGAVPIGHGTALDVEFLSRALRSAGRDPSALSHVIDTTTLARRAVTAPRYTLEALSSTLGLPSRRWHRAGDDAQGVRALFDRLLPEFAAESMRDLWQVRVGQRDRVRVRDAIARALERLAASRAPCSLVVRTAGRSPYRVRGVVERWTPPHVLIEPVNGPRRVPRLVRADRILRIEPFAEK